MGKKFVSLVCVLCAIHSHCAIHHSPAEPPAGHNLTRAGWLYAERLGSGLNPHLDLKPVGRKQAADSGVPRPGTVSHESSRKATGEKSRSQAVLAGAVSSGSAPRETAPTEPRRTSLGSPSGNTVLHESALRKAAGESPSAGTVSREPALQETADAESRVAPTESRGAKTVLRESGFHEATGESQHPATESRSARKLPNETPSRDALESQDWPTEPQSAKTFPHDPSLRQAVGETVGTKTLAGESSLRLPRESAGGEERDAEQVAFFIRKVFDKFGDGETITYDGFKMMMGALRLDSLANELAEDSPAAASTATESALAVTGKNGTNGTSETVCLKPQALFKSLARSRRLTDAGFQQLCPSLLYQLTALTDRERADGCVQVPSRVQASPHTGPEEEVEENRGKVWLYSTLSIIAISLCGLLGVAVIPIMKNLFYQQMLQFFVALAVGTLCGDALLHLLPHAMASSGEHSHSHEGHDEHSGHDANMWKGLVAALGVVFLFFTEKCLALVSEWRQHSQRRRKVPPRVRVMRDTENLGNATVGEKLCKHKYSAYPYCYDEITTEMTDDSHHKNGHHSTRDNHNHTSSPSGDHAHNHAHNHVAAPPSDAATNPNGDGRAPCIHNDHGDSVCKNHIAIEQPDPVDGEKPEVKEQDTIGRDSYTVILREHERTHHGHSHTHGHVHSPPESMSAVAWMVVMGDGLHNFTDGMAIGAAFASNIAGGFSTAVAVFCHELPHELGDFAVLLKAGMSAKQAVFYNVISSVLCLVGMVIGVSLGNWETATQWIFAAAAGMFLYIALVDMIPELTSSHSKPGGSLVPFALQITGLLLGLGIMFTIAMHEEALKNVFTDKP